MDAMMSPSGPRRQPRDPQQAMQDAEVRLLAYLRTAGSPPGEAAELAREILQALPAHGPDMMAVALDQAAQGRRRRLSDVAVSLPAPCDDQTQAMLAVALRGTAAPTDARAAHTQTLAPRLARSVRIVPPVVQGEMIVQELAPRRPSRLRKLARQVVAVSREAIAMIAGV